MAFGGKNQSNQALTKHAASAVGRKKMFKMNHLAWAIKVLSHQMGFR
jgi:hypothetical protein